MRKNPKNWGSLTNDPAKSFSWNPHGWVSCFPWIRRKLFPYTFSSGINSLSSCWLSRFHPMELGSICVVFRSAIDGFLHASTFLIFSSPTFTISEDFLSHGHSTPAKCWPQISGPDQAMLPPILCWKPKPPPVSQKRRRRHCHRCRSRMWKMGPCEQRHHDVWKWC